MDQEKRSIKYIEFHMFETFHPIFLKNTQEAFFWHNDQGLPRYESVINKVSFLFPPFNPESNEYDNYNPDF